MEMPDLSELINIVKHDFCCLCGRQMADGAAVCAGSQFRRANARHTGTRHAENVANKLKELIEEEFRMAS